jgi:hypothetical protein
MHPGVKAAFSLAHTLSSVQKKAQYIEILTVA